MNIVIVGAGKAGFLHFNSYYKLYKIGLVDLNRIFFVDPTGSFGADISKLINIISCSYKVYKSFDSLLKEEQLVPENTIIDLCIPSGTFIKVIQMINMVFPTFWLKNLLLSWKSLQSPIISLNF